ncbi:MAG TPA: tRNA pseudouridine(38-40) synthase TruA [Kiritimatiellia bacterium]|nr:tRNA pseudouridine(38-40) synthase TruA [Kiritimatiellia bacterium]HNR93675.1 tRNA pseudouridine(38-40) synthase TruA [Kiritimatiellia bacterium]HNS80367.1 tRNA pseudouridine(38-40) synthase TruA [Kiritimatiellia bacterium]HPA78089.1 tRNA pseudouridine(38-40) synthase TruA [Kiritimatiellia bacterium]HQQ04331.1 tRNA pseudouridine(38-40) synthase TruA [Kiritimatiellia bacterium]
MTRYRLIIAYDGTAYAGWQIQPDGRTIQGELENAIHRISGQEKVRVQCSGRTDTGVHARAQAAHVDLDHPMPVRKLLEGCNALLDEDIRVLKASRVSPEFHARFSAASKEYRYFIWNGNVVPPHVRNQRTWVRRPLDVQAMKKAAAILQGEHDFAAFTANPNREVEGTVRNLSVLKISKKGHEVIITARAGGFLYKMVRSLAGFLIRVGNGDLPPEAAGEILRSKKRTAAVPTAAPQGLFLWRVFYGQGGES